MSLWLIITLSVIGGLLLLILFLLSCSVTAYINYTDDFRIKVRYLFFTFYPNPDKIKNKSDKKKQKEKVRQKKQMKANPTKPVKKTFVQRVVKESGLDEVVNDISKANKRSFDFEMFKLIYDSAKPAVRRLVRQMKVQDLQLDCVIGGNDAAKVALTYGFQSAAISAGLAWLNEVLTLKIKKVNVTADFEKEQTEMSLSCRVRIRVGSALSCMLGYIINTAKNSNKSNKKEKRNG
jgi:hypothetical protein